jgi:hypothetical protein
LKHIRPLSRGVQPVLDTREREELNFFMIAADMPARKWLICFLLPYVFLFEIRSDRSVVGSSGSIAEQVLHLEEVMVESCHRGETAWTSYPRGIYCSNVKQPCTFTLFFLRSNET